MASQPDVLSDDWVYVCLSPEERWEMKSGKFTDAELSRRRTLEGLLTKCSTLQQEVFSQTFSGGVMTQEQVDAAIEVCVRMITRDGEKVKDL